MPKRGRKRKKSRTHVVENENNAASALTTAEESKVPKTLVIRRGRCEAEVGELVRNLRNMMMPYTALHFQDDAATHQHATLSRYVKHLALPMGITHMLAFSQSTSKKQQPPSSTEEGATSIPASITTTSHLNLRLVKTPQGPTLWFRVHQFSLNRHVQAIQKRPYQLSAELNQHPPIVVTNNFGGGASDGSNSASNHNNNTPPHVKLMRITFQNMFPAINVATVSLSSCRRVVLFHMIEEDEDDEDVERNADGTRKKRQLVQVRHYAIKTSTPKAVQNRRVQRLLHPSKTFPNLHHVEDIADYIVGQSSRGGGSIASDSEVSDDEDQVEVVLPKGSNAPVARKKAKKTNDAASANSSTTGTLSTTASSRSATLKLVELGPRMTLELIKVEKGLESSGSVVLYHAHIQKRPEEVQALQQRHEKQILLKRQRQAIQQANVERKQKEKQQQQEESKKNKKTKDEKQTDGDDDEEDEDDGDANDFEDDEEVEMAGDDNIESDDDDDN